MFFQKSNSEKRSKLVATDEFVVFDQIWLFSSLTLNNPSLFFSDRDFGFSLSVDFDSERAFVLVDFIWHRETCQTLFLRFRPLFIAISPINSMRSAKMLRLRFQFSSLLSFFGVLGFFYFSFFVSEIIVFLFFSCVV